MHHLVALAKSSKVTSVLMVRREHPFQSRFSHEDLIAHAPRIAYVPGGQAYGFDRSAPLCVAVPTDAGALFPLAAPPGVQLAGGVASRRWRPDHSASAGPAWPPAAGLPALPTPAVPDLWLDQDTLLWWGADQPLQALPPPEDGLLSLVGDGTLKGIRGPQPPAAHNTCFGQEPPDGFGFRSVRLMAPWDRSARQRACKWLQWRNAAA